MLFQFVGGPKDGDTGKMPSRQTITYVVRDDAAYVYSREGSRFVFDKQVTLDEYREKTWFWGFQNDCKWPPSDDDLFGDNGPLVIFYG